MPWLQTRRFVRCQLQRIQWHVLAQGQYDRPLVVSGDAKGARTKDREQRRECVPFQEPRGVRYSKKPR